MFEKIASGFIENTIIGSLIILMVFLFSIPIKKNKLFSLRYWLWFILAIRMIIPFKIQLPGSQIEIPDVVTDGAPEMLGFLHPLDNFNNVMMSGSEKLSYPDFFKLIGYVWLTGLIVYFAYYIFCYILVKNSFKKVNEQITDARIVNIFNNVSENLKIRHKPKIMFCRKTAGPLTIGFLRPELVLPERYYSDEELNMIFKHELTHLKRHDNWYKLFMIIMNALHWFNPLVYVMVNTANNDMELCCDNEVIKNENIDYKKNYGTLIISHIDIKENKYFHGSAVYLFHNKRFLKERIDCIFKASGINRKIAVSCLLIFTAMVVSSFAYSESVQDLGNNYYGNDTVSKIHELANNKKYFKPVNSNDIAVVDGTYIVFAAETGNDVSAIYEGIVDSTGYHFSYGNYIKIKGTDGIDIVYCHLENISVSEKQNIKRGQTIGTSGNSGYTSVNACGLRAFKGEERINITEYIDFTDNDKITNIDSKSYFDADKEALFQD